MSLVQVVSKNLTTPGTTQTSSAIATTAKNTLLFFAVYNAAVAGAVTPSDSTSRTWTPVPGFPYVGGATGLTLMAWTANASGSGANTFTFATTNADTPTIIIGEASGRDAVLPVDSTGTGSDSTTVSGAHTTGAVTIIGGGADVLSFTVSSALAQSYASTGAWAIPPNGTITSALGYDAFVQYQNSVPTGSVSNTYSVTISDKLDAIIVALRTPTQVVYSDEYYDHFDQQPEVTAWPSWYQQFDLRQQIEDVPFDWSEDSGENEAWGLVEVQSAPVGANNITPPTAQYYGSDAELLDETLEYVTFVGGYQQSNSPAPNSADDPWDYFELGIDEAQVPGNYQQADVVATTSQPSSDDFWEDEDPDEFFADDYGNDDADPPQNDAYDYWLTDDDEYWVDDYLSNVNANPALLFLNQEDGWGLEHFVTLDADETWTEDGYENDSNPLLNVEDPTWWDEEPDQLDGTAHDLSAVGPDNNGDINADDSWPWGLDTDNDDYVVVDDYALVDAAVNSVLCAEDAYGWFPGDPDDELFHVLNTDPVGPTLIIPFSMPPEDPWDQTQAEDDWFLPDDYAIIDVAPSLQTPVQDAWDHFQTDEDEYALDEFQSVNNKPTVVADGWDHWLTDPDDELFQFQDQSPVTFPQPLAAADPIDHWTQDADDEEWIFRNTESVEPKRGLQIEDAWQHWLTDEDDWAVPDHHALVNNVPPPSQFTDDNFDWFYEPAEDNEQDFAVTDGPLARSVYLLNPNFVVYIPLRPFTVIWGAVDADL